MLDRHSSLEQQVSIFILDLWKYPWFECQVQDGCLNHVDHRVNHHRHGHEPEKPTGRRISS